jgi:hypothetical protein
MESTIDIYDTDFYVLYCSVDIYVRYSSSQDLSYFLGVPLLPFFKYSRLNLTYVLQKSNTERQFEDVAYYQSV